MSMKRIYILANCLLCLLASCQKDGISGSIDVDIEMDATDVYTGDVIHFKARTAGVVARYDWEFEGGTPETSPLSSPEVKWLDAGNYTVTLTVSNKKGSAAVTKRKVITIDYTRSITADFTVDRSSATNEEYIQFTSTSEGCPTSFLWTFTSNTGYKVTSTEENPLIKLDPGTYTVSLKAYNPLASDTMIKTSVLYIIDKDAVDASFVQDRYLIAEGGKIRFNDISLGSVAQWYWEFEGGTPSTSSEMSPSVTYSVAGDYKVKLTVKNDISESSVTVENSVNVISAEKLVTMLPFDGDMSDIGPNGYSASAYSLGGAENTFTTGHNDRSSGSVYLPGGSKTKSSLIQLPADNWQSMFGSGSDMTLSMWVNVGALSAQTGFFAMGSCPGVLDEGNNQIWARMQVSNGMMRMLVESYQSSTSNDIQVENTWADGQWHHFAFVYKTVSEKSSSYMYVDGELVGSSLNKPVKLVDTTPFFIGGNMRYTSGAWAPECCLDGYVDDLVLYARALNESEIVKLSKY